MMINHITSLHFKRKIKCLVVANIPQLMIFCLMFFDVLLTSSRGAPELQGRAAPTYVDDV